MKNKYIQRSKSYQMLHIKQTDVNIFSSFFYFRYSIQIILYFLKCLPRYNKTGYDEPEEINPRSLFFTQKLREKKITEKNTYLKTISIF